HEQALVIHREVGNRQFEGIVLGYLATLHQEQGRMEEARQLHEQALVIHREVGNRQFEGIVLGYLATLHQEQGRMEEARQLCEQALVIHREVGNRRDEGIVLGDLADWRRLTSGDLTAACEHAVHGEGMMREVGDRLCLAVLLCQRGHIELAATRTAREFLDEVNVLASAMGVGPASRLGQSLARLRCAQEAFDAGEHDRLFRGQLLEDLTEGQRRWLVECGHLERERAVLPEDAPRTALS
ncbi:MAG: tetratricopeptide repeat protein, partial [Candidatus Schekmanbacteria bacterium]|nr:tetratricopeptide repeat protein [Candidatus Schekmanbacteria bacterium]